MKIIRLEKERKKIKRRENDFSRKKIYYKRKVSNKKKKKYDENDDEQTTITIKMMMMINMHAQTKQFIQKTKFGSHFVLSTFSIILLPTYLFKKKKNIFTPREHFAFVKKKIFFCILLFSFLFHYKKKNILCNYYHYVCDYGGQFSTFTLNSEKKNK